MRVALFGGTFDPVHSAHLAVAREAAARVKLDRVLFVPNAVPPHKIGRTPFEDRFHMVELACGNDPRLVASDLERHTEKSYSILTIEQLLPEAHDLYFLIGADAFADVMTWHRWRDVVRFVTFIVMARPGSTYAVPPGARVVELETLQLNVSSTRIREQLARGEMPEELPVEVAEYIRSRRLYGF